MGRVHGISWIKQPPAQQRYAKHMEISVTHRRILGITGAAPIMEHLLQHLHVAGQRLARTHHDVYAIRVEAGKRQVAGAAHLFHTWNAAQPRRHLVQELHTKHLTVVLVDARKNHVSRKRHLHRDYVLSSKTWIDR